MTEDSEAAARVIRPGDPDHPSEQVKHAGRPAPSGQAVYHARITVALPPREPAPSIEILEATVATAVANLIDGSKDGTPAEPLVKVDATRTDI